MNYRIGYPLSPSRRMYPYRTVVRLNGAGKYYLLTFIYVWLPYSSKPPVQTDVSIAGPYTESQSAFIQDYPTAAITHDGLIGWALDMLDEGQFSRA